jgi:hypothetical protein
MAACHFVTELSVHIGGHGLAGHSVPGGLFMYRDPNVDSQSILAACALRDQLASSLTGI